MRSLLRYILDPASIYGEYRTKRLVLEAWERVDLS